jgi:hypothetical protein
MPIPIVWRVVNAIRRWREDRSREEGSYLQQLRAVYLKDGP